MMRRLFSLFVPGFLITAYAGGIMLTRRRNPDLADSPTAHGLPFEDVEFKAHDGVLLRGWWITADNARGTIVQCAGQNGSMDADLPAAKMLHEAGFNVLMFDFRGHGRSEGNRVTMGWAEAIDVEAAINYLEREHSIDRVGILGFSMGTLAALRQAQQDTRIQTMVLDGVTGPLITTLQQYLSIEQGVPRLIATPLVTAAVFAGELNTGFPMGLIDGVGWAVATTEIPVLYIHGAEDRLILPSDVHRLHSNLPKKSTLWSVPGVKHREAQYKVPDDYRARVTSWFEEHLVAPVV